MLLVHTNGAQECFRAGLTWCGMYNSALGDLSSFHQASATLPWDRTGLHGMYVRHQAECTTTIVDILLSWSCKRCITAEGVQQA